MEPLLLHELQKGWGFQVSGSGCKFFGAKGKRYKLFRSSAWDVRRDLTVNRYL